jgi:HSP20 family protein
MYFTDINVNTPWSAVQQLERLMENFSLHSRGNPRQHQTSMSSLPLNINIRNHDQHAIITAEIPGIDPTRISLFALADTLTININPVKSDTQATSPIYDSAGLYSRTVRLPFTIDSEKTEARCIDGLLQVSICGPQPEKPKTINVKVG